MTLSNICIECFHFVTAKQIHELNINYPHLETFFKMLKMMEMHVKYTGWPGG